MQSSCNEYQQSHSGPRYNRRVGRLVGYSHALAQVFGFAEGETNHRHIFPGLLRTGNAIEKGSSVLSGYCACTQVMIRHKIS